MRGQILSDLLQLNTRISKILVSIVAEDQIKT